MNTMRLRVTVLVSLVACVSAEEPVSSEVPEVNSAQQDQIASAESAAPESISADATIIDWEFNVLRKGTNGWTCLPDPADTPGTDLGV